MGSREAHEDSREVTSGEDEEGAADEERGARLAAFEVDRLASCVAALQYPDAPSRSQYGASAGLVDWIRSESPRLGGADPEGRERGRRDSR